MLAPWKKSFDQPRQPQDWRGQFLFQIPKKGNAKECSNDRTIALISHASKVMLKILQARLQQYGNHELPDVQAGFRKGRGSRDQIANIHWIIKKAREFQENIYFCFIDYAKAFDCVNHHKLWKILKEMRIPDHLTCLLRNLYAAQEATVRTGHGTTDWFQIGKEICHLGMVVTMTADPKCGTQQVIQLFHTMSWLLFLESTSSTTSSTSYEFNGVIQGYGLVLNTMGNTWEPLVITFFEITVYYRNCSSEMNSAIHGP